MGIYHCYGCRGVCILKYPQDCEAKAAITGKAQSQNFYPTENTAALTGPAVFQLSPLCCLVSGIVSRCPGLAEASFGEFAPPQHPQPA